MKKTSILLMFLTLILSGCLYPEDRLTQKSIPYEDQLQSVQRAVDRFKEDNGGIIPIKDRDMETPIYQKYPIDFGKITPQYIPEPPSTAFESGGIYQYVLVDVEENPTVKLIDLRLVDKIRELKSRILVYKRSNGFAPFDKELSNNVYSLNYEKLGFENPPTVESPYSSTSLPFIIDHDGEVYIDYSIDLNTYLQKKEYDFKPGQDIRDLLVQESVFVPAFSVPYSIENNEPVFHHSSKSN
ncbi:hypothetical protein [Bacillus suaedaesalsae]|uniref:ABC transporter periplasmic binding protein yphF n=1 Tax=Bacillus suaedaesalsae TaxID=2810349 RepID=A0ABS2DQ29_9BACI|nr:hypothetical protein [Bacillus suaedaesalsae]MBM6619873.1 hypothetical protein [Bacillus suaedaesalsae]